MTSTFRSPRWRGAARDCGSVDVVDDRAPLELSAQTVAAQAGGRLRQGPPTRVIGGFTTDSRRVVAGQLFIALRGERFDGARFVAASLSAGASGVLVPAGTPVDAPEDVVVIDALDTLVALQELGRYVRRQSGAQVVAITGSAGKTSTKEATADFLSTRYTVYRNAGNLNNHIGLPLSLLELCARPDIAVVELGMNHAGEIRRLVELSEPEVRVWTNVGDAHVGYFGSVDAIADAKAEVLEGAGPTTRLVANADDARVMSHAAGFPGVTTTFGLGRDADVRAVDVRDDGVRGTSALLKTPAGDVPLRLTLAGRGPLLNVLAAAAVALAFGVPLEQVAERAATLAAAPRRGEVIVLARGLTLIDDSYNSSPAALSGALDALASERPPGRRIAVLGEMRELGALSMELHQASGRRAVAAGVDALVAVGGDSAQALADAAIAAGLPAARVSYFGTSVEAADAVSSLVAPGDVVLVKGSRGTRMDVVADRVKEEWA
jgi:UDP-N-acetylmuramoyl-tripeptide--D-alanyl-D-alanine ligase